MKITLDKLKLRMWKGVRDFVLDAQGRDVKIYGDNATGKTTLVDAWRWLLFGKDSRDQANFEIKTLDESGEPLHNLEHETEGVIRVNGKSLMLKKIYREVWEKKRGSAKKSFSGNTTDHFINDVPVSQTDYNTRLAEIIDEKIFKILTSPSYFNEVLHWTKQREILLEASGDITNTEVIDSYATLGNKDQIMNLTNILNSRSIDEHRKIIKSKQKKINDELKKIPVRIDEVTQGLPEITSVDAERANEELSNQRKLKKKKEEALVRLESGGEIAEKQKRLAEIDTELQKIKNNHTAKYDEMIESKRRKMYKANDEIGEINMQQFDKKNNSAENNSTIERIGDNKKRLRENWYQLEKEKKDLSKSEWEGDTTCPTCGQALPDGQIEESRANFNRNKAEKIEIVTEGQAKITEKGQMLNREIEGLKEANASFEKEIEKLDADKKELQKQADELQVEINDLDKKGEAYKESRQYKKKLAEKKDIEQQIEELKQSTQSSRKALKDNISRFELNISQLEKQLAQVDQYELGQKRVQELSEQEKKLAAEYENLEAEIFLCEEFERVQSEMLEKKINSRFKVAKFKLFKKLNHGGIEPCCETLVNGVPYSTNLNSGAKINVGLDIINTLSGHYNFWAPIFIDGKESVTKLTPTESQVISLIVSEKDKKLRVEVEEKGKMKEAV